MLHIVVGVMPDCVTQFVTLFSSPVSLDDRLANNPAILTVSASRVFTCVTAFSFSA